jgi:hypothetical protein
MDLGSFSLFHPLLQTTAFFVGLTAVYVIMQTLHPRKPNLFSLNTDRGVKTHMTLGVTYVSVLLLGFLIGPIAITLAGITPFHTLHSYLGIAIACLIATGGSLGILLSRGVEQVRFFHMTVQLTSLALLAFQASTGIIFLLG